MTTIIFSDAFKDGNRLKKTNATVACFPGLNAFIIPSTLSSDNVNCSGTIFQVRGITMTPVETHGSLQGIVMYPVCFFLVVHIHYFIKNTMTFMHLIKNTHRMNVPQNKKKMFMLGFVAL